MKNDEASFEFQTIATIESCFQQKFAIPRQSSLVKEATAKIIMAPEFQSEEWLRGLEMSSHIWVLFIFHKSKLAKNKKTVRPPRLGGEKRMGVLATRSNYRPNPIGQSVVKLDSIEHRAGASILNISGGDFLDHTPVIDIKPYLPYADSISEATSSLAPEPPKKEFNVIIEPDVEEKIQLANERLDQDLSALIKDLLSYDVRDSYDSNKLRFATVLYGYDVHWKIDGKDIVVVGFRQQLTTT